MSEPAVTTERPTLRPARDEDIPAMEAWLKSKGYETGAIDYLPVPFAPEVLRAKIRVLADLHRKTQQLTRLNAELEQRVAERTDDLRAVALRLRTSEERFRSLVQHAADIIAVLEPDGTLRHVSPASQTVLGLAPDKLCGTKGWDLAHPSDVESAHAFHTELVAESGATRSIELRWQHRDGSWRFVSVKGTNLLDQPGVRGIVLNARGPTVLRADYTARVLGRMGDESLIGMHSVTVGFGW